MRQSPAILFLFMCLYKLLGTLVTPVETAGAFLNIADLQAGYFFYRI